MALLSAGGAKGRCRAAGVQLGYVRAAAGKQAAHLVWLEGLLVLRVLLPVPGFCSLLPVMPPWWPVPARRLKGEHTDELQLAQAA